MDINFMRYKPLNINIEVRKLEKIELYKYIISKKKFEEIKKYIEKNDVEIEIMKQFLYNTDYLANDEVSTLIYKIKVKAPKNRVENLEYCYYHLFLKYYGTKNMENIYNAIVKLGKKTLKYMELPNDKEYFLKKIQKLFYAEKNIKFLNFLYEEYVNSMKLTKNYFYEEFFIEYDSKIGIYLFERFNEEFRDEDLNKEMRNNRIVIESKKIKGEKN